MTIFEPFFNFDRCQQGAALIVSLLLLLVMTLLGVTAMQSNLLEEKMAGNFWNRNLAFQGAEAALRNAETFISSDTAFDPLKLSGGPFQGNNCTSGLCPTQSPPIWQGQTTTWWTSNASCLALNACYVIELMDTEPSSDASRIYATFRITAWAQIPNSGTRVILQTRYKLHAKSFAY